MKRFNLIISVILIFCLAVVFSNTNHSIRPETSDFSLPRTPEKLRTVFSVSDTSGPVIDTPTLSNPNPDSDEDVDVAVSIEDIDGVQNATLFWKYTSINETLFSNTAVGSTTQPIIDTVDLGFDLIGEVGYVTETGVKTSSPTLWRYGEYTYDASVVSSIDVTIGVNRALVYVIISARNFTTGEWQIVHEAGGYGLDDSNDLGTETYQSTTPTLGYSFFAVSYDDLIPRIPRFDDILLQFEEYSWTIPAANDDTFVEYYFEAYDDLNQSSVSDHYTFLMDFTPIVTIIDPVESPRVVLSAYDDLNVNVSVIDPDGAGTVDTNSGIVYYRFVGDTNWSIINMDWFGEFANTHYFTAAIPAFSLLEVETTMELRANVSDRVGGIKGREGRSPLRYVDIDSLAPRVTDIAIESYPGLQNITLSTSQVNIDITVEDSGGIKSVNIYYSMPNGTTFKKMEMTNTSLTDPNIDTSTFNVTLPATNETAFVEYYFETEDFYGNNDTTTFVNIYYADGTGPNLDLYSIYPAIISNYSNALVLFNSSDYSGSMQPVLWYSFDDQISWSAIGAATINYQILVDHQETFRATNLHYIEDNAVSSFPLEIIRTGPVDTAILTFEITHEMPTDLRIWLKLDDGRQFMLFDREPGPTDIRRDIEITRLGISEAAFTKGNFTLVIQDFSELFSGAITRYEIELIHHSIPLGYQYIAVIPASVNDTMVYFFITMTDNLWNSENSSIFHYYSDGLVPSINVIAISSPIDLAGKQYIQVSADIYDQGGIVEAETYYKFSKSDYWSVGSMILNSTTGLYYFDVPLPTENGTLYYMVRAFDFSGLSSETTIYTVRYTHGLAPFIEVIGFPYPSPLDMNGTNTIRIWANVTDIDGTVLNCTIGYRFEETNEWKVQEMIFDEETGFYYFDVKVNRKSGNLTFIIYATDNLYLTSQSDPHIIEFVNAGTAPGLPLELILFGAVLAIGGGGSVAVVVYLHRKGKLKLPERFRRD
ncbi:MAG: hypothetical protein ACFFB2_03135 [Promethearchaeota archaeon]